MAVSYAAARRIGSEDTLFESRHLIDLIAQGDLMQPGAVFAGLLSMGDDHICALLNRVRDRLTPAQLDDALQLPMGFPSLAVVAFWVDWLETLQQRGDEARIECCARALVQLARAQGMPPASSASPPASRPPVTWAR